MMQETVFIPETLFDGVAFKTACAVRVSAGQVQSVTTMSDAPPDTPVTKIPGLIAPAFIDLQIYGGKGHMFSLHPSVEALSATYEHCLEGGTAHFMATVATNAPEIAAGAMEAVRQYWSQGRPGLLGLHLEGPYLNEARRGAHLARYITAPTLTGIRNLLTQAGDTLKMITLAPECCAPEIISSLLDAGIVVSAGHSDATYEQAMEAFGAGIGVATHLYNAMSPLTHRQPGLVGALFDGEASASIVADGIHVGFPALRIAKRIMGDRLFLITDAITEACSDSYTYLAEPDRYVTEDGTLAGSRLTLAKAVRNLISEHVTSPAEALRMASLYPAGITGLDSTLGRIAPGYAADWVVLDRDFHVTTMVIKGVLCSRQA